MQTQVMGGADIPTFSCGSCGYAMPNTMPAGMKFPCPSCQAPIKTPGGGWTAAQAQQYQAWALEHGNTVIAQQHAQAAATGGVEQDPSRANFSLTSNQILIRDGHGRRLVIGSHVDESGRWALRAQDAASGQLAWEGPRDLSMSSCPDRCKMGVRRGLLLLVLHGGLQAFDPNNGARLWSAQIGDEIETRGAVPKADEMDIEWTAGVLCIRTRSEHIVGIDAQTGQRLWNREADAKMEVVGDFGLFLRYGDGIEIIAPRTGQVIASYRGGDYDEAIAYGNQIVIEAEQNDQEGFAIVDAQNGQLCGFVPAPGFDLGYGGDSGAALGRLVVALSTKDVGYMYVIDPSVPPPKPGFFASLFGSAKPGHVPRNVGRVVIRQLCTSDDAIITESCAADGGPTHVQVLDPQTLAPRHDSGPLAYDESLAHSTARGSFAAYVVPLDENRQTRELRVVHTTTGQVLWTRKIGYFQALYFDDDGLVVQHDTDILLLGPSDGSVICSYPKA